MRSFTGLGLPALACVLVVGCGSPTAPTSTEPAASALTESYPAPVSQTATGTWFLGARRFMTITQNGASVTGMPSPAEFEADGVTVTESGLITGVVNGNRVTLALTDRITLTRTGLGAVCTASHIFNGVLAGNTLSGTMIAQTTPLTCAAGVAMPAIDLPVSGPTIYTRQ